MSEMKLIKQWHLSFFDEQDVEYIRSLGCEYKINNTIKTRDVVAANGQVYRYVAAKDARYGIYVTTTNKQQESLLMLKYSGSINLLKMFYVDEWTRYELQPDI